MNTSITEQLMMNGKVIIVTGGARGIGFAIARTFLGQGGTVVCVDKNLPGQTEKEILREEGYEENFCSFECDITDPKMVTSLFKQINKAYDHIDVLVNNAGIIYKDLIEDIDFAKWKQLMNVNVDGAMLMARSVVPIMKQKKSGRIVNISSIQAFIGTEVYSAYASSKAAIRSLTKVWAQELAKYNINVNAICPGFANTIMAEMLIERTAKEKGISREEAFNHIVAPVPQKRLIEPEEIGIMALFLSSDLARGLTGQSIVLSGGNVMP